MPKADPSCGPGELAAQFGDIDIYLFDQLLRGRITPQMRVLDPGCGGGRNAHYLMRCGADVHGVDADGRQIERMRSLAAQLAPALPVRNFVVGPLTALPWADGYFAAVICSAVLHFATDEAEFEGMLAEMWRVLDHGGVSSRVWPQPSGSRVACAMCTDAGISCPTAVSGLLSTKSFLLRITSALDGELLDPLKTTNVQNLRAMTTWVVRKRGAGAIRI